MACNHLTSCARPSDEVLRLFKEDLWKDQRILRTKAANGAVLLEKYSVDGVASGREAAVLAHLRARASIAQVPAVCSYSADRIVLPYIRGIRLFNLLIHIRDLPASLSLEGSRLRDGLLERAEEAQREIQRLLSAWPGKDMAKPYAVAAKLERVVRILSGALDLRVDQVAVKRELAYLEEEWNRSAWVPFRDATPKNMVLEARELWLGRYEDEHERQQVFERELARHGHERWADTRIVDFDFASCDELTTPEDDAISLLLHEATAQKEVISAERLAWLGEPSARRAACTCLVRYFRLGGRKAAYAALHPEGAAVRFRHDNAAFYFLHLREIMTSLWKPASDVFPGLLDFAEQVSTQLHTYKPQVDWLVERGLAEPRQYYVDMFPTRTC